MPVHGKKRHAPTVDAGRRPAPLAAAPLPPPLRVDHLCRLSETLLLLSTSSESAETQPSGARLIRDDAAHPLPFRVLACPGEPATGSCPEGRRTHSVPE